MAVFMEFHQSPVNSDHFPGQIKKTVQWVQDVLMQNYDDQLNISLGHSSNQELPHCLDIGDMKGKNIILGFSPHGFLTGWGTYDGSCCERLNPLFAYIRGLNIKQGDIDTCFRFVIKELEQWVNAGTIGRREY